MTNKVLISAVLGAVVGAGAALLLRPATSFQVWTVSVKPEEPKLSANPLTISKNNKDEVRWFANAGSYVYVEFEQKIFANATLQPNGRYSVKCNANVCDSGRIVATLSPPPPMPPPPSDGLGYKYWFGLTNAPTSPPAWNPNGRIIINP
jgi:hypothetical protein